MIEMHSTIYSPVGEQKQSLQVNGTHGTRARGE